MTEEPNELQKLREQVKSLESENKDFKEEIEQLTVEKLQIENAQLKQMCQLAYEAALVIVNSMEGKE